MTGQEIQSTFFNPLMFILYLFVIFVLMIAYYQWQWHRKADNFVKVIVREADGSCTTHYAPKSGTSVAITNPHTGVTRVWPFTDVCTIEMLYPGDGFIPTFLQRKIRTLIVDAEDWEPLLNRGAYVENVASPDVKARIMELAESITDPDIHDQLIAYADSLLTAPTREMIASPAVLGNIAKEKVSELAVTVAKDIMNPLQEAIKKLGRQLNPTLVYILLGVIAILLVYTAFEVHSLSNALSSGGGTDISSLSDEINKIKNALGMK